MGEGLGGQVQQHAAECLSLGFVDGDGVAEGEGELLARDLKVAGAEAVCEANARDVGRDVNAVVLGRAVHDADLDAVDAEGQDSDAGVRDQAGALVEGAEDEANVPDAEGELVLRDAVVAGGGQELGVLDLAREGVGGIGALGLAVPDEVVGEVRALPGVPGAELGDLIIPPLHLSVSGREDGGSVAVHEVVSEDLPHGLLAARGVVALLFGHESAEVPVEAVLDEAVVDGGLGSVELGGALFHVSDAHGVVAPGGVLGGAVVVHQGVALNVGPDMGADGRCVHGVLAAAAAHDRGDLAEVACEDEGSLEADALEQVDEDLEVRAVERADLVDEDDAGLVQELGTGGAGLHAGLDSLIRSLDHVDSSEGVKGKAARV